MYPKKEDPIVPFMEELMGVAHPIERQETRGQQLFVNSETLPHKFNVGTREQLEQMGIVYGEQADDLFSYVTLPNGWTKQPTDHSMWSKLLDEQGRERASIFYKAAFYDRDAFINLNRRYTYSVEPVCGWQDENYRQARWHCVVKDADRRVVWSSDSIEPEPEYHANRDDDYIRQIWLVWIDKKDRLGSLGSNWLDEHFPDWKNPVAYWD